jgi:acetyl esterase
MVFAHGGGFSWGTLDDYDVICRNLCAATGADIVSIDYRLAPQHPFPHGLNDICSVLREVIDTAPPDQRIVVAGDSAGGCLAAGAAQCMALEGVNSISGQLLIYPMMEYHDRTPQAFHSLADRFHPSFAAVRDAWDAYLQSAPEHLPTYAIPPRSPALDGLPSALTIVAENDPLRFEAIAYAELLRHAGVPSVIKSYGGTQHGFLNQPRDRVVDAALKDVTQWLSALG